MPLQVGALDPGALHLWSELLNINMPLSQCRTWVYGQSGGNIRTPGVFHVNGNWAAGDIAKNMKGDAGSSRCRR